MEPAAAARRQQRADELCAATIRALAADPVLQLRGRRLWRGAQLLPRFGEWADHPAERKLRPPIGIDNSRSHNRGARQFAAMRQAALVQGGTHFLCYAFLKLRRANAA